MSEIARSSRSSRRQQHAQKDNRLTWALQGVLSISSSLMVLIVFILLIGGTWGVIYVSLKNAESAEQERLRAELGQSAYVFAEQVKGSIKAIESKLDFLAYELVRDSRADRLRELVESRAVSLDTLVQLAHVDSQARTISTHLGPDLNLTSLSDREHIRVHLDRRVNGLFIGKPVKGRVSGKWSIQLTRALKDANGLVHGVVVASLDPFYFERFWSAPVLAPGMVIELFGEDGVVRSRSDDLESALNKGLSRGVLVARSKVMGANFDLDQTSFRSPRYAMTVPLEEYALLVTASLPEDVQLSRLRAQQIPVIYAGGAASGILVLLCGWLAYFSSSLRDRETEAIAAGARLLDAIETAPNGFSLLDPDGRLMLRNKALQELLPSLSELLDSGETVTSALGRLAISDDKLPEFSKHSISMDAVLQFGARSIQLRARRTHDGEWAASWSDITAVKTQEAEAVRKVELLQNQTSELERLAREAQQAAASKAAFLASMSHEIRTPLHAIIGFADLLAEDALTAKQSERVSVIRSSGKHLRSIVDDILDFSQIQAGKVHLAPEAFDVILLLREAKDIAAQLLGTKAVNLCLNLPPLEEFWVTGDRRRILQCLLNLLSNAIKFTDHGVVSLELKLVEPRGEPVGLAFTVSDTGIGINKAMFRDVLEPFKQDRTRAVALRGGTGLGLSITRDLVELMGGSLEIQSREGEGSAFTITLHLPAGEQAADKQAGDDRASNLGTSRRLKVLVADDVKSARLFIKLILERMGHVVTECQDGAEALHLAETGAFDLIMLDIQMPVMDGLEAARQIRGLPHPECDVFIVALTAQALEDEIDAAKRAGINVVISKPFSEAALMEALNKVRYPERFSARRIHESFAGAN